MKALAGLGLVVALPFLVGEALFTRETDSTTPSQPGAAAIQTSADGFTGASRDDISQGVVDLYGNEVSEAIATYSLDRTGTLYELHSPQTELPRLGNPKS